MVSGASLRLAVLGAALASAAAGQRLICSGCYKDDSSRMLPTLLGSGIASVATCEALAVRAGLDTFANQNGGQCWGCLSTDASCTPFALGPVAGGCAALGGPWQNQVCTIGGFAVDNTIPAYPASGNFSARLSGLALRPFTAGTFNVLAFEFNGSQTLTITYAAGRLNASSVVVYPLSLGITATVLNATTFTLPLAGHFYAQVSVLGATDVVTQGKSILFVFADAPTAVPNPSDPSVYVISGKQSGNLLFSRTSLSTYTSAYLSRGALLTGTITVNGIPNFKVHGPGALTAVTKGGDMVRTEGASTGATISNLMILNGMGYSFGLSSGVAVSNVKLLTTSSNTDGLVIEGSHNVTVSDSFLLNGDNMIDLGFSWTAVTNILVQRCTFSNSRNDNWIFIQSGYNVSHLAFNPTVIGSNVAFVDNHIIRVRSPQALITTVWGAPASVSNILVSGLTVDIFVPGNTVCRPEPPLIQNPNGPSDPHYSDYDGCFLYLQGPCEYGCSLTLANISLPNLRPSNVAKGWTVTVDGVTMNGAAVKDVAQLDLYNAADGAKFKFA